MSDQPEKNESGEWVCPECGETYRLAMHLGLHRRSKHGVEGASPDAARKRNERKSKGEGERKEARQSRIAKALKDLANTADDLRGQGDGADLPERLSDLIRRDADRYARVIAAAAEAFNPIAFFTDRVLNLVAPALDVMSFPRWLLRFWREKLEQQEREANFPPDFGPPPEEDAHLYS